MEGFRVYGEVIERFDLLAEDCALLKEGRDGYRLVGQLVASADSIPSNTEEGNGRASSVDDAGFLAIDRGSAPGTRGHHLRLKHGLPEKPIEARVSRCAEIIAGLTKTTTRLRSGQSVDSPVLSPALSLFPEGGLFTTLSPAPSLSPFPQRNWSFHSPHAHRGSWQGRAGACLDSNPE